MSDRCEWTPEQISPTEPGLHERMAEACFDADTYTWNVRAAGGRVVASGYRSATSAVMEAARLNERD